MATAGTSILHQPDSVLSTHLPAQVRRIEDSLSDRQERLMANALGWFSIGLGALEVLAPRQTAQLIGARNCGVLPWFGWREIAAGIGILSQRRPASWMWGRVAGDVMDLAFLAAEHASGRTDHTRLAVATAAVAGVTMLDLICAERLSERPSVAPEAMPRGSAIHVRRVITINRSAQELYEAWRRLEDLPRYMRHLKSVRETGEGRSHWVAHAPAGMTVEWDAELTADEPARRIQWQSLPGGNVSHRGSVQFEAAPGDRGTQVLVELHYEPTGGVVGASIANLLGESPEFQVQEDLRHFKQIMETGEIVTTEGQPSARGRSMIPGL